MGRSYRITCTVLFPEGIIDPITIEWFGPEGRISNGDGIMIGATVTSPGNITNSLVFNPFRSIHGGQFSCKALITSQTPPFNISKAANVDIVEAGKYGVPSVSKLLLKRTQSFALTLA